MHACDMGTVSVNTVVRDDDVNDVTVAVDDAVEITNVVMNADDCE